jgi:uncharacterized coiled-coil protein SlyX
MSIRRRALTVVGLCLIASGTSAQDTPTIEELVRLIDTQQKVLDEQGRRLDALEKQLDDPEGTPWVMRAFTTRVDPSLTYDGLKSLD